MPESNPGADTATRHLPGIAENLTNSLWFLARKAGAAPASLFIFYKENSKER